jgi:hypothetical protein
MEALNYLLHLETLKYLLIGLPIVIGIILRFSRFDEDKFVFTLGITEIVYSSVGIGYAYVHWPKHPSFLNVNPVYFLIFVGTVSLFISWFIFEDLYIDFSFAWAMLTTTVVILIVFGVTKGVEHFHLATAIKGSLAAIGIIILFCFMGAVNALLGPILAGFTIAATLHSVLYGNGIHNVFFWTSIFNMLDISNSVMQIIILVSTSVLGVGDSIVSMFEQWFS